MNKEEKSIKFDPLPNLSKFKGQTFVIKYGGSIMKNNIAKKAFFNDVKVMRENGINIIIVHGGGPLISFWLEKAGIQSEFINGLRVTDENVMEIVQMVLCGMINKDLSLSLNLQGVNAVGISGIDGKLIEAHKKYVYHEDKKIDIGFVGEIININEKIVLNFLKNGQVPVISPVGYDNNQNKYNINADYVASYISSSINADKLIILTDVEGVYKDINNKDSLISRLTIKNIESYIKQGIVSGGMIPKMECCVEAIKNGTKKVHLVDGRREHCLINDLFYNRGTVILNEKGECAMPKSNIMNTYGRFDVIFEKGNGTRIYDTAGNEYIDFVSGVAVNCLGHSNPVIIEAIKKQSEKLMHISNYYWNSNAIKVAEKLCENSDHQKVFFCNSGTEAVETSLKLARKYGTLTGIAEKSEIIYMKNSFHGRTMGALSVTGQGKYQESFKPLIGNVKSVKFNDINDIEANISEKTCAVIIEPIQGEGGIIKAQKQYLETVRKLCNKYNALLIFDEVQCGIGRCGTLFAYQKFGVVPDVIAMAKALGGGFPIGAVLATEKAAEAFVPGDHGNTYGGNPLATGVSLAVLTELIDGGVIASVDEKGQYITDKLNELKQKYGIIKEIRGEGLLIGICLDTNPKEFINKCFEKKLLLITAGVDVVRLLPPLNVSKEDIDIVISIIEQVLREYV